MRRHVDSTVQCSRPSTEVQAAQTLSAHERRRRREARTLWERIQYVVKPFADTGYPMFRYTIDAEIRAYYVRARKWGKHEMMRPAAQEWPLCLMPRSHGLFGQRKQYAEENSRYHSHSHSGHVLW